MTTPPPPAPKAVEKTEKAPKADVQTLAYLLKEIDNRLLEERRARKQFALSLIVFGVFFIVFGVLRTGAVQMQYEQERGVAALRREAAPQQPSPAGLPFAVGFGMIAYGVSKQW